VLTFFGLTQTYRLQLFRQIHDIVFHGKGGFDFHTVYNFPIWLRNYTYKNIEEHYKKEQEAYEKNSGKKKLENQVQRGPAIKQPSYSSKARK